MADTQQQEGSAVGRYAVIEDGRVANVVLATAAYAALCGWQLCPDNTGPGHAWPPAPQDSEQAPTN